MSRKNVTNDIESLHDLLLNYEVDLSNEKRALIGTFEEQRRDEFDRLLHVYHAVNEAKEIDLDKCIDTSLTQRIVTKLDTAAATMQKICERGKMGKQAYVAAETATLSTVRNAFADEIAKKRKQTDDEFDVKYAEFKQHFQKMAEKYQLVD